MEIKIQFTNYLTDEERNIRKTVFMDEQGFVDEFDDEDIHAEHAVLYADGNAAVCCRFFEKDGVYMIGRFATMKEYRGLGLGAELYYAVEEKLKERGVKNLALSAQLRANGFYKKLGFTAVGKTYLDESCEHIRMEKTI